MKITNLKLDLAQFGNKFAVIGITEYYKYKDGLKTDEIEGYKYETVLLDYDFEKISIKIPGECMLEKHEKMNILVEFQNLEIGFYQDFKTKELHLKCTAKGVKALK